MATHSSNLAWEIPWMEEPGGLQSMGSRRVRHDLVTEQQMKGERENNTIIAGDVSISLSTTDRLY